MLNGNMLDKETHPGPFVFCNKQALVYLKLQNIIFSIS